MLNVSVQRTTTYIFHLVLEIVSPAHQLLMRLLVGQQWVDAPAKEPLLLIRQTINANVKIQIIDISIQVIPRVSYARR